MAERDVQARVFALGAEVGARAFVVQLGRTTAWEFYTPVEAGMKKGGTLISVPWVPLSRTEDAMPKRHVACRRQGVVQSLTSANRPSFIALYY
jgi:hypothetical protein